jgi:pimeloyl-ACP methyl ester carboxylesterase
LADDVAATKRVIAEQDGPVTLVGHSYGGAVITEAGNDPKVARLVYIAGFAPDNGESVNTLNQGSAVWRAGAADPAAAGRLSIP